MIIYLILFIRLFWLEASVGREEWRLQGRIHVEVLGGVCAGVWSGEVMVVVIMVLVVVVVLGREVRSDLLL